MLRNLRPLLAKAPVARQRVAPFAVRSFASEVQQPRKSTPATHTTSVEE